jgi:hypothetical protein
MADTIDRKLLDKRVAHRYVRKGLLDEKDWEKHLKTLPDVAAQAVPVESDLDHDDFEDDEDEVESEAPSAASASEGPKEG